MDYAELGTLLDVTAALHGNALRPLVAVAQGEARPPGRGRRARGAAPCSLHQQNNRRLLDSSSPSISPSTTTSAAAAAGLAFAPAEVEAVAAHVGAQMAEALRVLAAAQVTHSAHPYSRMRPVSRAFPPPSSPFTLFPPPAVLLHVCDV